MSPRLLLVCPMALALVAGCDRMNRQPKIKDYAPSALFADGQGMRLPPEGTAAIDDPAIRQAEDTRPPMTAALLSRGQDRYGVFCVMCHDAVGDGDGVVPGRGFPRPEPFSAPDQRALSDRQIMAAVDRGYGAMYGVGDRVPPADRWAITAYVRALQLSQDAPVAQLDAGEQAKLEAAGG
jgi:mono/diheme cytochrome c family protein